MQADLHNFARNLVYPGLDLHVRARAVLRAYWKTGERDVLDAGSGNGYFSWLAYSGGACVTAMNIEKHQVEKARDFLVGYRRADPHRLCFEHRNLYDLADDTRSFDEIICFETLEHIKRDRDVVEQFYRILRPGGFLHLCCPNRRHPRHRREVLDLAESGGHVRPGYAEEDYRALLEPIGFTIDRVIGVGTPPVYWADTVLRYIRTGLGDLAALPLFALLLPVVWLSGQNPRNPFSLYVRGVK